MKRCNECRVDVNEVSNMCPLCNGTLEKIDDNKEEYIYPKIEHSLRKYRSLFKVFIICSIIICIFSLLVNYITYSGVKWSLILIVGVIYWWATIAFSINSKLSKTYKIVIETIMLGLIAIIYDILNGYTGISINYAIPILTTITNSIVFSIIVINKTKWKKYVMYQLTLLIIGVLPLICIPFDLIFNYIPLSISVVTTLAMFIATLIYKNKDLKDEYIRIFHI